MYIQDQVSIDQLDDGHLGFFRAIGVDSIHLDLRGGAPAPGRRAGTGSANTSLAQEIRAGKDCTDALAQAREKVEAHGMKLNNIFMPAWEEITLAGPDMDEKIGHWCRMLESVGRAGIPCVGWNFKPMGNFRTPSDTGRGRREIQHLRLRRLRQGPPRAPPAPRGRSPDVGAHAALPGSGDPRGREGGRAHGPAPRRPAPSPSLWAAWRRSAPP